LTTAEAFRIAMQVAEGLSQAHAKGIVHRDVTPGNVIVAPDGTVKMVDFGLAKLVKEATITRSGSTLGTVAYMSPEQTRGEIDYRSDLWALGVVLYEMLAGRRPFQGGDSDSIIYSIRNDEPPALVLTGEMTSDLERILEKALAKDVSARYQSASQMAHDLRRLERNADAFSSSLSTRVLATGSQRRVFGSWRSWTLLALALLAAGSAIFLRPDPELALLSLEYEGPASSAELVDLLPVVLADELRASTRLRVTPFAASRHYPVDSDPEGVRRELGVDWVLDGMVSVA
jgi:serine/threonine protein kinase